jgi:outer membrane protein OmpA-like peptidoglycan-associated protein
MNTKLFTGMGLALALGACVSMPQPNAALETARSAVQTAEADPNVNKFAPLELDRARKELSIAEDASLHHQDAEVDQPAYLATQNARLAQAHGAAKADDARVAAGQIERDQIVLASRTREAENARASAANSRAAADVALNQRDQAAASAANSRAAADAALNQRDQAAASAADSRAAADVALNQRDQAVSQRDQANDQTARANGETARVQAELDALKATPTPRGLVMTLGDVLFDTGRAELKSGAGRKMDQLGQFLVEHADRRVQIDGFTDSVGTDSYNEDLSQRRADAVKTALINRGVQPSRIGTEGYGKAYPVANNNDSGGRQLNRRVEVVIGGDNGTAISPRAGL